MSAYKISVNGEEPTLRLFADSPADAAREAVPELYAFHLDGALDPDESVTWQIGVKTPRDPKTYQFTVKVQLAFTITETT